MPRKWLIIPALLLAVLALVAVPRFAPSSADAQAPLQFSGAINDNSGCMRVIGTNYYPYDSFSFTVPANGVYTLTINNFTWPNFAYFYLFENSFDPNAEAFTVSLARGSSPGANIVQFLSTGTTYYIAVNADQNYPTQLDCVNRTVGTTRSGTYGLDVYPPAPSGGAAVVPASNAVPVPGCDLGMPISLTSVVGRFVATTETYWLPGQVTDTVIPVGQSAWVLGVDDSGAYYQIVWSCDLLWVPVEAMGPNYDDVWNGAPLPTGVVN